MLGCACKREHLKRRSTARLRRDSMSVGHSRVDATVRFLAAASERVVSSWRLIVARFILSLDSTTSALCLDLFPWATFRRAKGGVKAHVLLDHDDYLPSYALITEAKQSDVRMAHSLDLNAGSIVAIDRGYCDYALFGKWDGRGVFFVTRLKDNAAYEVGESFLGPLPRHILAGVYK